MDTAHHVEVGHAAENDEEMDQSQEDHHEAAAHWSKLLLLQDSSAADAVGYSHVWHFALLWASFISQHVRSIICSDFATEEVSI